VLYFENNDVNLLSSKNSVGNKAKNVIAEQRLTKQSLSFNIVLADCTVKYSDFIVVSIQTLHLTIQQSK